jgi:hypothetical protein
MTRQTGLRYGNPASSGSRRLPLCLMGKRPAACTDYRRIDQLTRVEACIGGPQQILRRCLRFFSFSAAVPLRASLAAGLSIWRQPVIDKRPRMMFATSSSTVESSLRCWTFGGAKMSKLFKLPARSLPSSRSGTFS